MKKLIFLLLLFPGVAQTHPGVGIVKDSKGNIFYTDLQNVYKLGNGIKTIAVANVHTHELFINKQDELFGAGGYYDSKTEKFFHYLWVYHPNGRIDTVLGMRQEYVRHDFSLAKDHDANEYYLKRFIAPYSDTTHIYKKPPHEPETVYATGQFKAVNWLHPQDDASLLYASTDTIYRVSTSGKIHLVKVLKAKKPTDVNRLQIWGLWQDKAGNIYAAILNNSSIVKVDRMGNAKTIYSSANGWMPLHGLFDDSNRLWIMEGSQKNEVRVTSANANHPVKMLTSQSMFAYIGAGILLIIALLSFTIKHRTARHNQ